MADISKATGYAVLTVHGGVSKALAYAVLSTEIRVSVSKAVAYAVVAPAFGPDSPPAPIGVDPASGPAAGGTSVTITGTGFVVGATVTFDTSAATSVVVVSDTEITCVTPAHAVGLVTVTARTDDGRSGALVDGFEYLNLAPVVQAGPAAATYVGLAILLTGSATDDGYPAPPGALTYAWSQVSGPGTAIFSTPASRASWVTFDVEGSYVLRLTADDGELQGTDDVTITVGPRPSEHAFDPDVDVQGETIGLTWVEFRDAVGGLHVSSKAPLPDSAGWYGGYKADDIIRWGPILRALSDKNGDYQGADFTWTLRDTDHVWRGLLAGGATRVFLNCACVIRMIADQARRAQGLARTIVRGFVRHYQPSSPLQFTFTASDWMTRVLTTVIPRRRLSRTYFPDLPPAAAGTGEPIIYGKASDEGSQYGPVTGVASAPQAFGSPVTGLTGTPSLLGGSLPAATTYIGRVTAVGDDGVEYDHSAAVTATTPTGTSQLSRDVSIPAPRYSGMAMFDHYPLGGGGAAVGDFEKYRFAFATALKQVGGVWKESDPSNWGVIRGDLSPHMATEQQFSYDLTAGIQRLRLYVFNVNDGSTRGFDPLYNPRSIIGVPGDTVRLIQFLEVAVTTPADRIADVYSPVCAPTNTTDYPRGHIVENIFGTPYPGWQWLYSYGDGDGADFVEDANHAKVDFVWDPWTPPPGVALAAYRLYYQLPNGDTRAVEISAGSPPLSGPGGSPPLEAYTLTDELAGALTDGRTYDYAVTATCPDGETVLSLAATGTTAAKVQLAPLVETWAPLPQATAYHIWRRGAGAAYDRRWDVGGDVTLFVDDLQDTGVVLVDGATGAVGALPLRHVGTEVIAGAAWSVFLVSGHACYSVVNCFQAGIRVDESKYGVSWLAPGRAGWPFAVPYRDIGDRRYTLVYVRGTEADDAVSGTRPITANVWGIEGVGDSTGALLVRSLQQYKHFLQNFAFGDWQSGPWLDAPRFPTDPSPEAADVLHVMDSASFDAADAVSAARIAGGYLGSAMIGADDEEPTVREMVARWNTSCDVDSGFSRRTQFSVWMEDDDPALLASAIDYTQERDIEGGSFSIEDLENELYNCRPYAYGYKPAEGAWTVEAQVSDAASIAALGETRTADRRLLYFVRLAAVAEDIIARVLARTAYPPRAVTWRVPLSGLSSELGDIATITHADGIGVGGWTRHPVRIRSHEVNPDECTVTLAGRDAGYLFEGSPGA